MRFQSSLQKLYSRLSGFQASLLPIYFRDVPNITLRQSMAQNLSDVWHSTFDRSCFWTEEALSSMIFVAAKKLYGIVWTKPLFLLRWCCTRRRRFLAQHNVASLLRYCFEWLQHCSNIVTLCCAKNTGEPLLLDISFQVTSPLGDTSIQGILSLNPRVSPE